MSTWNSIFTVSDLGATVKFILPIDNSLLCDNIILGLQITKELQMAKNSKLLFIMDDEMKRAIEAESKATGKSQADIVREAVTEYFARRASGTYRKENDDRK